MKKLKRTRKSSIRWDVVVIIAGCIAAEIVALYFLLFRVQSTTYCANSVSCVKDLTGEFQPGKVGTFMGQAVSLPPSLTNLATSRQILGDSTATKHIVVDLSTQRLTAYENSSVAMSFPVATGRWFPTPTGDFRIWVKLRYTHMEGGNTADGTYYNLYNVPYTMFFYNDDVSKATGFSLHGAYWHNNFGHPMSHGCVNLRPEDAGKLFDWAEPVSTEKIMYASSDHPGTLITITGVRPEE